MQVSTRELKNHLSKYLHLAQLGEPVIVTSHNKPVVSLASAALLQNGMKATEGVTWATGRASFSPLGILPAENGKTVAEMVIEDRG
ncbi:MAG: type II toxin-antitoxin system prevent-host-death family antitoxin [Sulfuricellaceae bacterium]|nr:type II toxin-antitoxin system prevent-host-death family antitoxin [Sulfuricellaceae bacterium]